MNTLEQPTLSHAPDLTQHAPRSVRTQLGGYAVLPRLLDKCRASLAGTVGDYHTDCPLDQEFTNFVGIDYDALRTQVATDKSDGELLAWIQEHADHQRTPWEISQWSEYQNIRSPQPHTELAAYFLEVLESHNKSRGDITSFADLLDLDDYCSFGGRA